MSRRPVKDLPYHHFSSVEDFETSWRREESGPIRIDAELPILLDWKNNRSDRTLVCFSAASQKIRDVPYWTGRNLVKNLPANILLVSDPSLIVDSTLSLGWYAGSVEQPDLLSELAQILRLIVSDTTPVLFGASAGGWAALKYAAQLGDAVAVPVNPQIDISRYIYYPYYTAKAWKQGADSVTLPFEGNVAKDYGSASLPTVVYVQNRGDSHHCDEHYPLFEAAYGESSKFIELMPDLGPGHVAPDRNSLETILHTTLTCSTTDGLREKLREIEIKSSGVDKEFKPAHSKGERMEEKYPGVAEISVPLNLEVSSFSVDLKSTVPLNPKALLFQVSFTGVTVSKDVVKQIGLSWSPALDSAFVYSLKTPKNQWIGGSTIRVPEGATGVHIKIRRWNSPPPN